MEIESIRFHSCKYTCKLQIYIFKTISYLGAFFILLRISTNKFQTEDIFCSPQKVGSKRILLFTNNDDPHAGSQQLQVYFILLNSGF